MVHFKECLRDDVTESFPQRLDLEVDTMFLAELHDLGADGTEVVTGHGWE